MSVYLKTEGLVLAKRQILQSDTMVTLFTRDKGKVVAVAKGIRSIKSRRISSLMTGNLVNLILYQRKDRYYLQEATIVSLFSNIKKNEKLLGSLYFFLFIINELLPGEQRDDTVYNLTKKFMIELSRGEFEKGRMLYYCNRVLHYFGYGEGIDQMGDMIGKIEALIGKKIPIFVI